MRIQVHVHPRYDKDVTRSSQDCNTCTCLGGEITCTDEICPGECFASGDPHYKTFDGDMYEFQGSCGYVLSQTARPVNGLSYKVRFTFVT